MHQPLPQAFPEYSVLKHPQGIREFRVETKSHFRSRNASVSYYAGLLDFALVLVFPILGAVIWQMVRMLLVYPTDYPLKPCSASSLGPNTWLSGILDSIRILAGNTSTLGYYFTTPSCTKPTNNSDLGFVESVIVLPSKDLQLEVHRGPPGRSMFVERRMIPASTISAVIINEGLHGWNVRYYLAVLTKVEETQSLHVLYEARAPFLRACISFS